uniref:C2H2-type domain-containing protein n=1 Tax=Esox lucius TaxID=8010 RepID=A0AAY5JWN9_ESOLU
MSKWPPADAVTSCYAQPSTISGHEAVPVAISPGYGFGGEPFSRFWHGRPSSESCYASHIWSSSIDEEKTCLMQHVPTEIQLTDGFPDAAPLAPSTVLTLAPTLGSLSSTLTPMTSMLPPQALVLASKLASSLNSSTGTETTSATGDGRASPKPSATSEPDMEEEQEAETDPETEEEKARRLLYCSLCKVAVNSASQLEAHNSGTKHKTMLEARSGVGSIKAFPRPGVKSKLAPPTKAATGLQDKTFHCEICNVHVNSETQLKQHISSRRHKDRAAGKPAKPKYSPYSKTQKVQAKQPVKLTVGKELCQPQMTHIIPAHLAALASAAAAMGSALPGLGPNHAPGPTLFHPLLRPAPGPIRTSHTQLLFAPY